jgi:tRNA (adenine37-N6)-methyltransferase
MSGKIKTMSGETVEELRKQIADLKKRWPAHSPPPAMMQQLDELQERLQQATKSVENDGVGERRFRLRVIGHVENEFNDPTAPDEIRSVDSRIVLDPSLVKGLTGIEPGQQLLVVFYFHRSQGFSLLQHPRGDRSRLKRGVFALRSPNRPTPIGVTVVDVIAVEANVLRVSGLDAINGTPVLDLKPA